MADPVIAIGGENLIDQVVQPHATTNHPGGSPFNVALAAARQGGVVRYVTPISIDAWGDMLAARLAEAGVQLAGGRVAQPSTLARVTLCDGVPSYSFRRTDTAERQVSAAMLARAIGPGVDALHTGSLALNDGPDAAAWQATMAQACQILIRKFQDMQLVQHLPNSGPIAGKIADNRHPHIGVKAG